MRRMSIFFTEDHKSEPQQVNEQLLNSQPPRVQIYMLYVLYHRTSWFTTRDEWGAFTKIWRRKAWILVILERLPAEIQIDSVVIVCDNSPCHSKLEEFVTQHPDLILGRLGLRQLGAKWFQASEKLLCDLPP